VSYDPRAMDAAAMTVASVPTPGAPEKAAVRSMFDRIAPRYDLLNRLLSAGVDRRWRRASVDALALPPAAKVLDVCTGTADLLLEFLRRDPGHTGVGVDLSGEMLARGADKLRRRGLSARSALAAGDAERLPVRAEIFDGALVAFGIRNVGEPLRALREIHRALKPGGRLVILEFSTPPGLVGAAYRLYFERVLPRVAGLVSGDRAAYSYLPASVARFPDPAAFGRLMEEAGFAGVVWKRLTAGIAHLHRGEKRA
jgi:demethylmenaquinone methyltransferase / 2-methoxy-6-polyprenyl-1,4-benzoquinol methylase